MPNSLYGMQSEEKICHEERHLFFRRWLRHPFRLGTFAPISKRFAEYATTYLPSSFKGPIVEIGAGTGRLTRSLLRKISSDQSFGAIELDSELCAFLRQTLPAVRIIEGNALHIAQLIPSDWVGQVGMVISVVPLMYLPFTQRKKIIENCFSIMHSGGIFLQVTYSARSPIQGMEELCGRALQTKRVGSLWKNFPPGFVWRYHLTGEDTRLDRKKEAKGTTELS